MYELSTTRVNQTEPSPCASPTSMNAPRCGGIDLRPAIGVAAGVLLLGYFLPWFSFLGKSVTGWDFRQLSRFAPLMFMPATAAGTLLLVATGRPAEFIRRLAGLSPFVILGYGLSQGGSRLLQELQIGAWLCLLGGIALILIPSPGSIAQSSTGGSDTTDTPASPATSNPA